MHPKEDIKLNKTNKSQIVKQIFTPGKGTLVAINCSPKTNSVKAYIQQYNMYAKINYTKQERYKLA